MKFKRTLCSAAVSAVLLSSFAQAADITGTVTDQNGKPVEGAKVTFEGTKKFALTDANGKYEFLNFDPKDNHLHIHVYSVNHIHGDRDYGVIDGNITADFTLAESNLDNIVVTANALQTSVLESVTPVAVLTEDVLRRNQAPSLGETLKGTPGVHSTYFGPVASSPIIRGTDGPRVKIVQNGLDVSDVSRVGPDHNVASDASTATQVEVLRGPATLQYGSGAIGGVVNVVDNRIPSSLPDAFTGEVEARYETAGEEEFARFDLSGALGDNIAFYLDGWDRSTEDYEIPGFAEVEPEEGEESGTLEGTAIDGNSLTAGISFIGDNGYFGVSMQTLDNYYGVPGHSHHHHEEDHDEDHDDDHEEGEEHSDEEESVNLDVDMDRYQWAGEWYTPFEGIESVKFSGAFTDYTHTEFEGESVGTTFKNETTENRLDFTHEDIGGWHGVLGFHMSHTEYEAIGDEAFSPPSETDTFAMYLVEEKRVGDVIWQLGARLEATDLSAEPVTIDLEIEHEEHDDDHDEDHDEEHDDDHDDDHDEHDEEHVPVSFIINDLEYSSYSLSGGATWEYQEGYSASFSLSHSQRAPSHQELFSAGEHIATQTFELGLLFDLDEDGEVVTASRSQQEEVSTNLDLTLRKYSGDWGYTVSFFYNQVDDYIYQDNTGLYVGHGEHEDEHDHDEEHDHEDEHEDHDEHGDEHSEEEETPIFIFRQSDADLYGFEAQAHYQLNDNWRVDVFGDYIRAELSDDNLPRIPPMRLGTEFSFDYQNWYGNFGVTWYDDQTKTAAYETSTDGYTFVDASINYVHQANGLDYTFFFNGKNLTDEEARVHSSFIKDQAPLPGRSFTLGVRAQF